MMRTPLRSLAPVLRAADMSRSLSFYCGQLGFEREFDFQGFYTGLIRDGCRIHLKDVAPADAPPTAKQPDPGQIDICIGVLDAAGEFARLAAANVPVVVPLRQMDYGIEFYIRDPDGHILAFVQSAPP